MNKKVSDIVARFLKEKKIKTVFGIIGSANAHIFDSINKLGYTKIINVHHEQAAVMAVGAYFRASGKYSAAIVTAGAGASNAITGVISNWADSIPSIIISGQEPSRFINKHKNLRMYGTQGFNITKMLKDVIKYGVCISDPKSIHLELAKCYDISKNNRPGPCWLDIPSDIQAEEVLDVDFPNKVNDKDYKLKLNLLDLLKSSKRPVILGGNGVRLSNSKREFQALINTTNIPTLLSWSGIDLLPDNHPYYFGRFGVYGQRCANFIIQNADLVLVLGSRLSLPQIGYEFEQFARDAKIIVVDIDEFELKKYKIHKYFNVDCKDFIYKLNKEIEGEKFNYNGWYQYCLDLKSKFPLIDKEHISNGYENSYSFIDKLSDCLNNDDIIVTDMGTALLSGHQAIKLKSNQKMFTSLGLGEMGYGLPGAIGASFSCPDKRIICLNCDGGIMMNLQELQTIIQHDLNIKIVIFNNDGYLMIKHTQKMLFNGNYTSVDKKTGISLPNFQKVFEAFGFNYYKYNISDEEESLNSFLKDKKQSILEVFMDPEQGFLPKVKGVLKEDNSILSPPLEEMSPLLSIDEVKENMIIKLHDKSFKIKR